MVRRVSGGVLQLLQPSAVWVSQRQPVLTRGGRHRGQRRDLAGGPVPGAAVCGWRRSSDSVSIKDSVPKAGSHYPVVAPSPAGAQRIFLAAAGRGVGIVQILGREY